METPQKKQKCEGSPESLATIPDLDRWISHLCQPESFQDRLVVARSCCHSVEYALEARKRSLGLLTEWLGRMLTNNAPSKQQKPAADYQASKDTAAIQERLAAQKLTTMLFKEAL
jgi:hypothetical protein